MNSASSFCSAKDTSEEEFPTVTSDHSFTMKWSWTIYLAAQMIINMLVPPCGQVANCRILLIQAGHKLRMVWWRGNHSCLDSVGEPHLPEGEGLLTQSDTPPRLPLVYFSLITLSLLWKMVIIQESLSLVLSLPPGGNWSRRWNWRTRTSGTPRTPGTQWTLHHRTPCRAPCSDLNHT